MTVGPVVSFDVLDGVSVDDDYDPYYRDFAGPCDGDPAFCDNYVAHTPHVYRALNSTNYSCPGITEADLVEMEEAASKECEHGLSLSLCSGPMHY